VGAQALDVPQGQRREDAAEGGTPQDYAAVIKFDLAKWGRVVKEAGIPME
jgi:hypothetical protein